MSNSTTTTEFTPQSSTLNLIKSKSGESNVWCQLRHIRSHYSTYLYHNGLRTGHKCQTGDKGEYRARKKARDDATNAHHVKNIHDSINITNLDVPFAQTVMTLCFKLHSVPL